MSVVCSSVLYATCVLQGSSYGYYQKCTPIPCICPPYVLKNNPVAPELCHHPLYAPPVTVDLPLPTSGKYLC